MEAYRHRQFGTVTVAGLGFGVAACLIAAFVYPDGSIVPLAVGTIFMLCAIFFGSLSIEVTSDQLQWSFGPGLISKKVALADIAEAEVIRTRLWDGWGIHRTRRGWLYNVSGFGAVAIQLKSGKRFVLGSDEPEKLAEALREATPR